jgi:Bacterial PH domain
VSDHDNGVSQEWSPSRGLVVLAWLIAIGAAGWFVALWATGADAAGQLLAAVAAIGATVAGTFGIRARPRLRADADGLTVGGLLRPRHFPWPFVTDVRVLRYRRLGREVSLLEVDTMTASGDEKLLVFGRIDLDADPEDVAPALRAARPS